MNIFKTKEEGEEKETAVVTASPKKKSTPAQHSATTSVIKRPHASEKAYGLQARNQYVFIVENSANKIMVKEEVQRRYNVKVVDVDMVVNKGKVKTFRGRRGKASIHKKAYVTLKAGDKIEIA
ncbi:MAG: 50S ribosomal protein L23 [bacterium]|nr:50S ribosomal protein L23 [Candidatus Jorgensenbacteria bacterium]